ncbi:MAG: hypothetical protein OXP71_11550 [Candidatus Poribacteria bacterium]|nr:hypothetical protein [Candidatus Poribacteria bacterium]
MRYAAYTLIILAMVSCLGCLTSSTSSIRWSENIAMSGTADDPRLNDGNLYSVGETSPIRDDPNNPDSYKEADEYSQAVIQWGRPQQVQRIIVIAKEGQLEFFEIQYEDENGKWKTVRSVRDHLRPEYKYTGKEPMTTRKVRLKVPRRWDSRRVGGEKRRTVTDGGAPVVRNRKIQEIEVYYALPPEEPVVPETSDQ